MAHKPFKKIIANPDLDVESLQLKETLLFIGKMNKPLYHVGHGDKYRDHTVVRISISIFILSSYPTEMRIQA